MAILTDSSDTAIILNFDTVTLDFERALNKVQTDPESAVTSACSTVESVCRSILMEIGEDLPPKKDVKSLFKVLKKPLGLSAENVNVNSLIREDVLKILSGLTTVVEGIGALRTHGGDAHGKEKGFSRLDKRIATLAIHSASTVALFLIETWQRKYPTKILHLYK